MGRHGRPQLTNSWFLRSERPFAQRRRPPEGAHAGRAPAWRHSSRIPLDDRGRPPPSRAGALGAYFWRMRWLAWHRQPSWSASRSWCSMSSRTEAKNPRKNVVRSTLPWGSRRYRGTRLECSSVSKPFVGQHRMREVDAKFHRHMPTIASSREDSRHIGNSHINRNMIGAVVGRESMCTNENSQR